MQFYVELWNAKQPWLDLSPEKHQSYFDKIGAEIKNLTETGTEIVDFALNNEDTSHCSNHRYLAVSLPSGVFTATPDPNSKAHSLFVN